MHLNLAPPITLREEEAVLQIINEVGSQRYMELDEELQQIIRKGQAEVQAAYEAQAQQRMIEHRMGINFDELREIAEIEIKQEVVPDSQPQEQSQLALFQQQTLQKSKTTEHQILELDREFPKLNYTCMIGVQQNIFGLRVPEAAKWISNQIKDTPITNAASAIIGDRRWIILGIDHQLIIFMGEQQKEPTIMKLNGNIGALAMSPCKKYIAVGTKNQVNIYEIRKASTLVLLKNFAGLKTNNIVKLVFYEGNGPKVGFVDEKGEVGVISLEIGMILTKVRVQSIEHQLERVDSIDAIRVNQKTVLVAIGGGGLCQLTKIEPDLQTYQKVTFHNRVMVSWRIFKDKIHLVIASDSKLYIYKLIYDNEQGIYYLEEHLLFLNHYPIEAIYRISPFHYLLQSSANFSVVALPLIPSVVEDPDLALSEAAMVFSFERQQGNRIIFGVEEGLLLLWKNLLQCGNLKRLQQEIDELMIQKCAFREAFSLLVLVCKGINYSFRFSYEEQDLKHLIHTAVQISTSALVPSLDERIVLFRVGWIVQVCIECGQQKWMWNYLYPNLKERNLQKHLFNMIQMFILKGQLVAIPEEVFLQIVAYYSEKGKEIVIQKLVLSNRQEYEASMLLSLLNQKQMNYLQFYLFSRAIISDQHDFYTPFIRAFSAFVKHQDQQTPKARESALLCYWIISKTFRFEHVPSGHMTRDTKMLIATSFFLQTLSKTFMRKLSDYNTKLFLECYLIPFLNTEFKDIIFEEESQIMASFKEFDINGEVVHQTQFVNAFLNYLENCNPLIKGSPLFAQYYATVLYLTRSQVKFERVVELLATLFENKFYKYSLRAEVGERPQTAKIKQYLLEIIKDDLIKRPDRLYIKKLLTFEDKEVGYVLYRIDKNYQAALENYLGNYRTNGIFELLLSIHSQIQAMPDDGNYTKERKKMQLRSFIIKNIGLLFRTDSDAALQICYLIGQTTQKIHEIVFKNPFENNERIFFLTAVLNRWSNQDFQFKQQYLLEHLQEVCMLPEHDMRYYLNKFYYPLDPAIKVADRKNNYLAKAILEIRSGLVEQAFSSYEKLIKHTLVSNREQDQTKSKVGCYLEQCLAICKQYSGQTVQENLWVRLIKFLASFVASEHHYKVYLKVELQRSTQNIINEMLRFLSTTLLINFFTAPSIPLPLYKLIPIYDELFRMVKFDRSTIQRSMLIVKIDILQIRSSITHQSRVGVILREVCDFCRAKLEEQQKALAYSCKHAFHLLCHEDPNKCLTCSYESDDFLVYRVIFKKSESRREISPGKAKSKKKVELPSDIYVQTKSQALMQARKKKLKLFDFQNSQRHQNIYDLSNRTFKLGNLQLSSQ